MKKALLKIISYQEVDIKTPRCENNLSLRDMAKKTGIDASNLSKYERGLLPIPQEVYDKIINVLTF